MFEIQDEITLQELVELISYKLKSFSGEDFTDELMKKVALVEEEYDLTEQQREYFIYSFVGLEEQSATKTLINASKAQQIIIKRKSK